MTKSNFDSEKDHHACSNVDAHTPISNDHLKKHGEQHKKQGQLSEHETQDSKPWKRWKKNQVIPAVLLSAASFIGVSQT